jgi:hypothetical protein
MTRAGRSNCAHTLQLGSDSSPLLRMAGRLCGGKDGQDGSSGREQELHRDNIAGKLM